MGQVQSHGELVEVSGKTLDTLSDEALIGAAAAFLRTRPSLKEALFGRLAGPVEYEAPAGKTAESAAKADGITLLYSTPWSSPRIHCRTAADAPWTQPPGLPMASSCIAEFPAGRGGGAGWFAIRFPAAPKLEFVLNDGVPAQWDNVHGGNYQVPSPGLWTLASGSLVKYAASGGPQPVQAAFAAPPSTAGPLALPCEPGDPQEVASKKGGIVLLYRTPWPSPCLHFRLGSSEPWTNPPGHALAPSSLTGYPASGGWWALHVPSAKELEFVPNDGGSSWDKAPSQGNYRVPGVGAWKVADGRVEEAHPPSQLAEKPAAQEAAPFQPEPRAPALAASALPAITQASAGAVAASLSEQMLCEGIMLLYRTAWPSPHLHCRTTPESAWTEMPGLRLPPAGAAILSDLDLEQDGGQGSLFALYLPQATVLEFVINDGGPHYRWDKSAGGSNFRISAGVWLLSGGRLDKVQPPPAAPGNLAVLSATRTCVSLAWVPATGSVRGYRVLRNEKVVATVAGGMTKYTDGNLLAASEYRYSVAAVSMQGVQGACSKVALATTGAAGKPGPPQELRVASASGKGVALEWSTPEDNGGAPITAYTIQRGGETVGTLLATGENGGAKCVWTDKDVEQGGSYSYTVAACHLPPKGPLRDKVLGERGQSVAPEDHDVLLGITEDLNEGPPTTPIEAAAVDELEAGKCHDDLREQLKSRGITVFYQTTWSRAFAHCCARPELGWTPMPGLPFEPSCTLEFPADEGWYALYFPYARSLEFVVTDGGQQWDKAPGQQNYKAAMPGVLRLVHGLMDRVAAPPQAPTGLAGEALDGSKVLLSWKPPTVGEGEAPVAAYKIFRNGCLVHTVAGTAASTFIDKNLFSYTDYEYAVAAVNNQEVAGPLGATLTVKTELPGPPSAPRNLRATVKKEQGQISILLEWEPPEDCGGAPVASYDILRNGMIVSTFDVPSMQLRGEAESLRPMAPEASKATRWLRHTCSYSSLSWFKDALEWVDTDVKVGESYSYQVVAVQLGPTRAEELRADGLQQRCGSRFLDNVLPDVISPACQPVEVRATPFLDPPKIGEQKCLIMFQAFDWGSCKADNWYGILLGLLPELRTAGINMMWLPPPSDSVDDHAYLPRKWYVLDNKYGSAAALQRLVTAMHAQEMFPMLDIVVNHRCASKQDSAGRWLKFEDPDWEGWAVCRDSPAVPGGTGAGVTGEPAQYAPSVDHTNPKVKEDVNAYIRYMMQEIGFRALRFDFVKGYAPNFQRDYVRAAGSPYAVAENWNGDANGLHEYVRQCQGLMAVYDFPLYYTLKRCVHTNNFSDLCCDGKLAGIAGRDPARSVTFIDNHDTYQLAIVGGAFGNNDQVTRAYALILTHPGVPCVFHFDYVRGPQVREKLLHLCSIRRDAGLHATSQLKVCAASYGLYAAIVDNKVAVKLGTNDWSPGGGWKFACGGNEFGVWTRS